MQDYLFIIPFKGDFEMYATFAYAVFTTILLYFVYLSLKKRYSKEISKVKKEKERAEKSNYLKSTFIANMSHEIRTPLNAIVGFSDVITQTNDPKEKKEYMKIISTSNQLLLKLIDDILDMSKIEAGTLEFSFSEVNLRDLLKEIHYHINSRNNLSGIPIRLIEDLPTLIIHTDKYRLAQVMYNFLSNALKFTKEGEITFGYRLCNNNDIYFFVRDTGIGIPADKKEAVFERFTRLNNHIKGTGLGLSICCIIIDTLQGHIGVESEEGMGSEFWFRLPSKVIISMEEQVAAIS